MNEVALIHFRASAERKLCLQLQVRKNKKAGFLIISERSSSKLCLPLDNPAIVSLNIEDI